MGQDDPNFVRYATITDPEGNVLYDKGEPTPFQLEQIRKRKEAEAAEKWGKKKDG